MRPKPFFMSARLSSSVGFIGLSLFGVFATGCIPLPFASPPVRFSGAIGGGSSGLASGAGAGDLRGRAAGRLGLSPLSWSKGLLKRPVDPEFGMLFEGLTHPPANDLPDLGGYLGLAWNAWQDRSGSGGQRVFLRGTADLVWRRPDINLGGGGSFSVGWEYSDFVSEAVSSTSNLPAFIGYAFGEGGVGFELTGAARTFDQAPVWQVTVGMFFRIPALAGILLVPIPIGH